MRKTVVAVRHVQFEDLGTFGSVLTEPGYEIRYCDAGVDDVAAIDPVRPDLIMVLGAPIGVYEEDAYPFLAAERRLLEVRLAADRPTFGVCLGAQPMPAFFARGRCPRRQRRAEARNCSRRVAP